MAECYFQILLYSLFLSFCFLFPQTSSLNFDLTNLVGQDQKFKKFGTAFFSGQGLELTSNVSNPDSYYNEGGATYDEPLLLWDKPTRKLADFNTSFVFVVNSEGKYVWDEFRFFLAQPDSDPADLRSSVAVVFNTAKDNNVTINVNSDASNVAAAWYVDTAHGTDNGALISYNSTSLDLSVVFTGSTNKSSVQDSISFRVDLRDHLRDSVKVGFYGRGYYTSSYYQTNTVKSWRFSSNLELNETSNTNTNTAPVPAAPAVSKPFSLSTVLASVFGGSGFLVVLAFVVTKKRQVGNVLINVGEVALGIGQCLVKPMCGESSPQNDSGGAEPSEDSAKKESTAQPSEDSAKKESTAPVSAQAAISAGTNDKKPAGSKDTNGGS